MFTPRTNRHSLNSCSNQSPNSGLAQLSSKALGSHGQRAVRTYFGLVQRWAVTHSLTQTTRLTFLTGHFGKIKEEWLGSDRDL
jgi:hypothetical protein